MLRASVAAEKVGIPSVSIVGEGFVGQAEATARGLGYASLPLAVLAGHVDSQTSEFMTQSFLATTLDQIIAGLSVAASHGADSNDSSVGPNTIAECEPEPTDIVMTGTIDDINRVFQERQWSDGLPIIPPTIERVEAFLAVVGVGVGVGVGGPTTLGLAQPSGREITLWSIAVNGVMAGCTPEQMPVLVALAKVIADPAYGVQHSGNTTGADALIIINGPSKARLGFNHGQAALRDGYQANTSIGRWWRLYLRNICGFIPGEHDKATFGNSARVVLSEDEAALAEIGWKPYSDRFGFSEDADVVTVARYNSGLILGSAYGSSPEELLPYLADGLTRCAGWDLTHVYGLGNGQFRPLLVLSPILARTFASAGWSQDDLRAALFQAARIPAWKFESLIGAWTNLTAGRRKLVDLVNLRKLPKVFAESTDPNRLVPIVMNASCIDLAVAGDPFRTNAYVLSNDGPHGFPTAKEIEFS